MNEQPMDDMKTEADGKADAWAAVLSILIAAGMAIFWVSQQGL